MLDISGAIIVVNCVLIIDVPSLRPASKQQHRRSRHIQHREDDDAAAVQMELAEAAAAAAAAVGNAAAAKRPPSRLRSRSHSQHSLLAMGAGGSRSRGVMILQNGRPLRGLPSLIPILSTLFHLELRILQGWKPFEASFATFRFDLASTFCEIPHMYCT